VKWFQVLQGMYEYRHGRYEAALEWLGRGRGGTGSAPARALADFYAAMSLHRLGNRAAAERALSAGVRLTPDDPLDLAHLDPMELDSTVGNWVAARIARREAEALIRAGAARPRPPATGAAETGPEEGPVEDRSAVAESILE
jgi:hypothetical protein